MNTYGPGKFVLTLALTFSLALSFAGCQKETPAPQNTPHTAGTFTGQQLPDKVEELEGTPLYSGSEELGGVVDLKGASYLLIAPQDPTKALVVVEEGVGAADVAKRESKPVKLSGIKETVDSKELVAHVKERYQLDLQMDGGNVTVLRIKGSATPGGQIESTPTGE